MKAKSIRLHFAFIAIAVLCMLASCTVYNPPVRYGQNRVYHQGYNRSYYRGGYYGGGFHVGSHCGGSYIGDSHYGRDNGGHH